MTCLQNYLDKEGVQPCGHSARASGIQLYLAVSCRAHEIPYQLHFSARACCNDKNTKELAISSGVEIDENQHSDVEIATKLTCGAENFSTPCLLSKNFTWEKKRISKRLLICHDSQIQRWYVFLLIDDDSVRNQIKSGQLEPSDYGQLMRSGEGTSPSAEDKEWINKNYPGHNYRL